MVRHEVLVVFTTHKLTTSHSLITMATISLNTNFKIVITLEKNSWNSCIRNKLDDSAAKMVMSRRWVETKARTTFKLSL